MFAFGSRRLLLGLLVICATSMLAQTSGANRVPAVPLVTHDPYFSIWSAADNLTDVETTHWTGKEQRLSGLVRIDGKPFRFMGASPKTVPALKQISLRITPLHTEYGFEGNGVRVTATFLTPSLPGDLEVLSRPVTYLTWTVNSTDQKPHSVSILLDVSPAIAVNTPDQEVTWGRLKTSGLDILTVGSREQQVLHRVGDDVRIDWGYFYLAARPDEGFSMVLSREASKDFVDSGRLASDDDTEMPRAPRLGAPHLAVATPADVPSSGATTRQVLLAYDEIYSVEYFSRKLRPYWRRAGKTPAEMLREAAGEYAELERRARHFDDELTADLEKAGGKVYAELGTLAFRQTIAAHGFAADIDGSPLLFPKENFSNGCISTVDVIYPASPFFLLFNPTLLESHLRQILEYAALPRWKFPFAPHDLGTYPQANGQVYGGGERTEENQMPVEESGNMLILVDALAQTQRKYDLVKKYWPQLSKWAKYLREKGLDPENQLSTDDFAGHLAHNANLSIKAIEGLAAYAQMAGEVGKSDVARDYSAAAKQMALQWRTMAGDGDHYKLAFDKPGTWSQKYNLVWDRLLNFGLFPSDIARSEITFYLKRINTYGLPLDQRTDYTKLDWEIWTATLADNPAQFPQLIGPIGKWLHETPTRVPLTDWYDTKSGKQQGFQARSVVGGVFIKLLADRAMAAKWQAFVP